MGCQPRPLEACSTTSCASTIFSPLHLSPNISVYCSVPGTSGYIDITKTKTGKVFLYRKNIPFFFSRVKAHTPQQVYSCCLLFFFCDVVIGLVCGCRSLFRLVGFVVWKLSCVLDEPCRVSGVGQELVGHPFPRFCWKGGGGGRERGGGGGTAAVAAARKSGEMCRLKNVILSTRASSSCPVVVSRKKKKLAGCVLHSLEQCAGGIPCVSLTCVRHTGCCWVSLGSSPDIAIEAAGEECCRGTKTVVGPPCSANLSGCFSVGALV